MISLNLLPDVKKEYLKSQRTKRLFIVLSVLISVVSIGLVVLMGAFVVGQRVHLGNVQGDIDKAIEQVQSEQDIDKVLTIQKQLDQLNALHDKKYATTRLFEYIKVLVSNDISLNSFELDNGDTSVVIKGFGKDFPSVNTFSDTLKNAEFSYKSGEEIQTLKPFSGVTLSSISPEDEEETVFDIKMLFDPIIFNNTLEQVKLTVPNITSSPSVTERPGSLFEQLDTGGGGTQP
jgi:hypothetical protein